MRTSGSGGPAPVSRLKIRGEPPGALSLLAGSGFANAGGLKRLAGVGKGGTAGSTPPQGYKN
jgi:hypothetical protein